MRDYLVVLDYECEDVTGVYHSHVILDKREKMYVAHYADFENVTSISRDRRGLDVWVPAILRTMLGTDGVFPKLRLHKTEVWQKSELA